MPKKIGKWTITYNPKSIPIRGHDYDVVHDEYDGDNDLFFTAGSVVEARERLSYFIDREYTQSLKEGLSKSSKVEDKLDSN